MDDSNGCALIVAAFVILAAVQALIDFLNQVIAVVFLILAVLGIAAACAAGGYVLWLALAAIGRAIGHRAERTAWWGTGRVAKAMGRALARAGRLTSGPAAARLHQVLEGARADFVELVKMARRPSRERHLRELVKAAEQVMLQLARALPEVAQLQRLADSAPQLTAHQANARQALEVFEVARRQVADGLASAGRLGASQTAGGDALVASLQRMREASDYAGAAAELQDLDA